MAESHMTEYQFQLFLYRVNQSIGKEMQNGKY